MHVALRLQAQGGGKHFFEKTPMQTFVDSTHPLNKKC